MRKKINTKENGVKNLTPQYMWEKYDMRRTKFKDRFGKEREVMKGVKEFTLGNVEIYSEVDGTKFSVRLVLKNKQKGISLKNRTEWKELNTFLQFLTEKNFENLLREIEQVNNSAVENLTIDDDFTF
jgi:hypothetical protein